MKTNTKPKNKTEENLTWEETLEALANTHKDSVRSVCEMLQCSRGWVNKYIRPFVSAIHLSGGFGKAIAWTRVAERDLGLSSGSLRELVWINTDELREYLNSNISQCTRKTVKRSLLSLLPPDAGERFIDDREYLANQRIYCNASIEDPNERYKALSKIYKEETKYINDTIKKYIGDLPDKTTRSKYPEAPYEPIPKFGEDKLQAVHDLKSYGDTDEVVHRQLFEEGAIRIELTCPDGKGNKSHKVYYFIPEPEELKHELDLYVTLLASADTN